MGLLPVSLKVGITAEFPSLSLDDRVVKGGEACNNPKGIERTRIFNHIVRVWYSRYLNKRNTYIKFIMSLKSFKI